MTTDSIAQLHAIADYLRGLDNHEDADYLLSLAASLRAENKILKASLAAAEADAARLDWLEEEPYWVTIQTQPSGEFIHSGSGHGIRAAIDKARGAGDE